MERHRVTHRRRVSYIDKSRDYYAAQGYEKAYAWAAADAVPFVAPEGPQSEWRVALVTTAALDVENTTRPFAAEADPVPGSMHTNHLSWHKTATDTDDLGAYLPLEALRSSADAGRVGAANSRFFGVPTLYSHGRTVKNAEQVAQWCREDDVDVAVLSGL